MAQISDELRATLERLRSLGTASTTARSVPTWLTATNTTTSPLQTSGTNAGTSPAQEERAEPMAYKKPEIIPGFRAEDPDMIHVIDQVGVLITETRLSNIVALLEYNAKIASIFNGRQVEALMNEVNGTLWE